MPGEAVTLGPFVGGMNSLSDPTGLEDNELVNIVNMELDLDGSLISRPPIYTIAAPGGASNTRMYILGWFVVSSTVQLIGCNNAGCWYYENGVWTIMTGTGGVTSSAMVVYESKVWIVARPDSVNPGGYWNGTTWTSVPAIPRGGSAVIHKERMYIIPGAYQAGDAASLLRWSDPANLTTGWPAGNTAYVNKGDGQKLIEIVVYNDNLFMFKNDSCYVFAFDNTPLQGVIRPVNNTIGVYDKDCVKQYENSLYCLHNKNLYEISDYNFTKVNMKVPFEYDATKPSPWADPASISIVGDRLLVRYYAKLYVYNIKTKTWSRWETVHYPGTFWKVPMRDEATAVPRYIAGSAVASQHANIYEFVETHGAKTETIICKIETKTYDFATPHRFKRLFWWGADVSNKKSVIGKAIPTTVNFGVTWGELKTKTWGFIGQFTWGQPLIEVQTIDSNYPANTLSSRKFIKFFKSLRFRQISFYLQMDSDGLSTGGPVRIFSLTAVVSPKETVSKTES